MLFAESSDHQHHDDSNKLFSEFFPDVEVSRTDQVILAVGTAVMILVFGELIQIAGPGKWKYFLAGGICAATSHAITTPIDVVKVSLMLKSIYSSCHVSVLY